MFKTKLNRHSEIQIFSLLTWNQKNIIFPDREVVLPVWHTISSNWLGKIYIKKTARVNLSSQIDKFVDLQK